MLYGTHLYIAVISVLMHSAGLLAAETPIRKERVHADLPKYVILNETGKLERQPLRDKPPEYKVTLPPEHGRLQGTPPVLIYFPQAGYLGEDRFQYTVSIDGKAGAPLEVRLDVRRWDAPVGVPAPPFGILESHRRYAAVGQTYDFGVGPVPYPLGADGPYTHFVNMNHAAATDDGNLYGTPEKPRMTIPEEVPAGSIVEVHGGPYQTKVRGKQQIDLSGQGTVERPVFYRGAYLDARAQILACRVNLSGSYVIVENFDLKECVTHSPVDGSARVVLRSCEIHDNLSSNSVNAGGKDVVVFNNYIHHSGNHKNPNDRHGMHVLANSERAWLIDNHVHHNTGDGVQFAHGARTNPPKFVYVARNLFHEDLENAVDIKYAEDVIVSENRCYGYRPVSRGKSGSDGTAIVLGSDGGPRRVWILNNTIWDSNNGIRNEETTEAWIMGNVLHGILNSALALEKKGSDLCVLHNTIYDAGVALNQFWKPQFKFSVAGNLFVKLRGTEKYPWLLNVETPAVAKVSRFEGNFFWQGGKPLFARWVDELTLDADSIKSFPGGEGNRLADPKFTDPAAGDFRLLEGSPALDARPAHAACEEFMKTYGLEIRRDVYGTPRPDGAWDAGACERP